MPEAIIHRTPGLIDVRAFTTMGLSAKPNSASPIGQFGTGLKYAIATLVRLGAEPVVWIGRDKHTFRKRPEQFRGVEYEQLEMELRKFTLTRARVVQLPYTTNYGKFWKPWMAFRELEANTRDENGGTYLLNDGEPYDYADGCTTIMVEHPEYVEAWRQRDDVFLPGALSERGGSEGLQVLNGASQRIYYRGLRAMDVTKPTFATYNVLTPLELTEDRTLKYEFEVRSQVARHLLTCDDEDLIQRIVTCDNTHWEHGLEFPNWVAPGPAFRRVAERRPRDLWGSVGAYYGRYDNRPHVTTAWALDQHPRPWRVTGSAVVDANDKLVFDTPLSYVGRWELMAEEVVKRLGFGDKEIEP